MGELVYLNGWVGPFEGACVSVDDRGYIFGDGVYEVIMAHKGVTFALDEHLKRLELSAAAIELPLPWNRQQLVSITKEMLQKSKIEDAMIYIQVTRGTAPRNHFFDPDLKPNILITIRNAPKIESSLYSGGAKVITHEDFRWKMCNIKTISLQANILAKNKARKAGVSEVVFVQSDGIVTECGSSNIFIYRDGTLKTHQTDNKILAGITRKYVIQVAKSLNINVKEEPFTLSQLLEAQEVFYTNTVADIMPVVKVDGKLIDRGKPGLITTQLIKGFISLKESLILE